MLHMPHNAPNTGRNTPRTRCFVLGIYFYTLEIERLKTPSLPLSRCTPQKAIKQSNTFAAYPLPYRYSNPCFPGYPLPCRTLNTKKEDAPRGTPSLTRSYLALYP